MQWILNTDVSRNHQINPALLTIVNSRDHTTAITYIWSAHSHIQWRKWDYQFEINMALDIANSSNHPYWNTNNHGLGIANGSNKHGSTMNRHYSVDDTSSHHWPVHRLIRTEWKVMISKDFLWIWQTSKLTLPSIFMCIYCINIWPMTATCMWVSAWAYVLFIMCNLLCFVVCLLLFLYILSFISEISILEFFFIFRNLHRSTCRNQLFSHCQWWMSHSFMFFRAITPI